jgi:hypothetical protein
MEKATNSILRRGQYYFRPQFRTSRKIHRNRKRRHQIQPKVESCWDRNNQKSARNP